MSSTVYKVSNWFAKTKNELTSPYFIDVEIHKETQGAILISGKCLVQKSDVCWRCNRVITRQDSIVAGVGPDCAAIIGLNFENLTNEEINNSIEPFEELWIPKSVIESPEDYSAKPESLSERSNLQMSHGLGNKYKGKIVLRTPNVNSSFLEEIETLYGFVNQGHNTFVFTCSVDNAVAIRRIARSWGYVLEVEKSLADIINSSRDKLRQADEYAKSVGAEDLQSMKKLGAEELDKFDWPKLLTTDPWGHQRQCLAYFAPILEIKIPQKG